MQISAVPAALDSLEHAKGCYIVPFERDGTVVGVHVFGIPRDSLPHQVGIENGDMIADVNGIPSSSSDGALRIRDEFRRSHHFTINLERDGRPMKVIVGVTEPG